MGNGKKEVRAFVGFQTQSEFQTLEQIQGLFEHVTRELDDKHGMSLRVTYGIFPPGRILWDEVRDSISGSDIAVFDVSENNANVMIEVGMAYGFGRQVIHLKNEASKERYKYPSDLGAIYIPYGDGELASKATASKLIEGIVDYLRETHPPAYYLKSLWGFGEYDSVLVICPELDEPDKHQHLEPNEFIYLGKYGDLDAFVEVLVTLHRLYPHLRVTFRSAGEVSEIREDYATNLILVGGPDYNEITGLFEEWSPFEYLSGETEQDIYLRHKTTDETYVPDTKGTRIVDYGFFVKRRNPYDPSKRLILIGGAHTYGVFGASKAFSYKGGARDLAYDNCKAVIESLGHDPSFCAWFKVDAIQNDVQAPRVEADKLDAL